MHASIFSQFFADYSLDLLDELKCTFTITMIKKAEVNGIPLYGSQILDLHKNKKKKNLLKV